MFIKMEDHGFKYSWHIAFRNNQNQQIIENLLIWTYDENETDKKYLDEIYYASKILGAINMMSRSKDLALINFLYVFQYKRVIKKLLKSNRSFEFKNALPRYIPTEYNIYNFGEMRWIDEFFRNNKKCYDDEFMKAYIGG